MRGSWPVGSSIELQLFGGLDIRRDGEPVGGFVSSKGPALVAFLVATGGSHTREYLAGLLWGEVSERDARASLRVVLSNLRQTLGPGFLETSRTHVALADAAPISSDLASFLDATGAAPGSTGLDVETLSCACALYAGDFLAGFTVRAAPSFDEWLIAERERLRSRAMAAFEQLAGLHAAAGEHDAAAGALERLLEIEPWHETAFRSYARELVLAGRRNAALVQFDAFAQMLEHELGVALEQETIRLYQEIRDGAYAEAATARPLVIAEPDSEPVPRLRVRGPATSFIGRDVELALLARYLQDQSVRLISLTGPGGSGKTRLALRALEEHSHAYDLAGIAMLAEIEDVGQIPQAVAEAYSFSLSGSTDPLVQLQRQLSDATALLLLDNFEHLIDAAPVISGLLEHVSGVTILVTSRERLALQAAWNIPLAGLLADGGGSEDLRRSNAVRLFVDRARQVQPDFLPGNEELKQIADICRQLDGLPLGIELAASWARLMTCAEIASRIGENLDFLGMAARDRPERHQSLRAVFDGSWNLLDAVGQGTFAALSVFSGGFTAAAARATANAELPDLLEFIDKSLVRRDGTSRFALHEVLRQYAGERLAEDPDLATAARDRHARYYSDLMSNAETRLKGVEQADTLKLIDAERSNLRVAWEWLVSRRQFASIGSALDGVGLFYALRQLPAPGLQLMDMAQAALQSELEGQVDADILMGRILGRKARFMLMLGQPVQAQASLAAADALLARHQAQHQLAFSLDIKGRIANMAGNFREASRLYQRSLEEAQRTGDRYGEATARNRLAGIAFDVGDFLAARRGFAASLEIRRSLHDWEGVARELGNLGEVACETGDFQRAQDHMEESFALYRELGVEHLPARLEGLGRLALRQGDLAEAHRRLIECRQVAQERGGYIVGAIASLRLAEIALLSGDSHDALERLRQCKEVFEAHSFLPGIVQWGVVRSQVALSEHRVDEALEDADQALALAEELEDIRGRASALGAVARAMLALGRAEDALSTLHDAIQLVRETGATPLLLDLAAQGLCALLAAPSGRDDATRLTAYCSFIQAQPEIWYATKLEILQVLPEMAHGASAGIVDDASMPDGPLTLDKILDRVR